MNKILKNLIIPNGHFADDLLIYGGLEAGGHASKGFRMLPPSLRSASASIKNNFHEKLRFVLQAIPKDQELQVQWTSTSDYREELLAYDKVTDACNLAHIRKLRKKKFSNYWEKMEREELRRECLVLFPIIPVETCSGVFETRKKLTKKYDAILSLLKTSFSEAHNTYRTIFGEGVHVHAMNDEEHFLLMKRMLSPSQKFPINLEHCFRREESFQQNCLQSEFLIEGDCFYFDGFYHNVFSLSRWPQKTFPGIIDSLTALPFLNYQITLNIRPLPVKKEVEKEEKLLTRLHGEFESDASRRSTLTGIEKKEAKIDALSSGFIFPFKADLVVRIWEKSQEGLRFQSDIFRQAVSNMNGAQSLECALPTSAKKLFFSTWPGSKGSIYSQNFLYAEDTFLADMVPFSSTFTGNLEGAEALYDGIGGGLVGVKTFEGTTPQHAVLFGMSGAGKSVHMQDILEQTEPYFAYTAIIEEGLSYANYTKGMGEVPIILRPDSELTVNYFDTRGMPLSPEVRASAVILVSNMVGKVEDDRGGQLRQSQIAYYIDEVFRDCFENWKQERAESMPEIERMAYASFLWKKEKDISFVEAFSSLREGRKKEEEAILSFFEKIREEEIEKFLKTREGKSLCMNTAFAFFSPEEFPQHRELVSAMKYQVSSKHNKQKIHDLATLLSSWTSTGEYGKLFDGVTNVELNGRVAHFELGQIAENANELKTACGLLLTGFIRQHIMGLPKKLRKRIIFEEVDRFLNVPGGEKIVREAYAQLRKYSCSATSVVQQYSFFKESSIRPVIMGNSKQFWIMKQMDRTDLEDLGKDIALPVSAMDQIQRFPLPEHLPEGGKYSSICYYNPSALPSLCGTLCNIQLEGGKK